MTTLQTDMLELYNALVLFNDIAIKATFPKPIKVSYDKESRVVVFEQGGKVVRTSLPVYYSLGLEDLEKPTYLLPEHYDFLMYNLLNIINSGRLLEDRTCLSPENYGFDIYGVNLRELQKGPEILASVRLISGRSWFFKLKTKLKYKL